VTVKLAGESDGETNRWEWRWFDCSK